MRYGQTRSSLFIILDGEASVWIPVKPRQLLKPLQKLRAKIMQSVQRAQVSYPRYDGGETADFEFRFHLDPFKIEANRQPKYCRYEDFCNLCSADSSEEFKKFVWSQFQLFRAADTIEKVDEML